MNLFINSPAYYTQEYGVIDEIYWFCSKISKGIDIKKYTSCIDTIGIVPIIAPESIIEARYKETKKVDLKYRMASISLISDYDLYCKLDVDGKKEVILDNILRSLGVVSKRLKDKFNYKQIEEDIMRIIDEEV